MGYDTLQLIVDEQVFEKLIIGNIEFRWKGFIFLPGLKDGKESLEYFINKYSNYERNIDKLYGSYVLIIKDRNLEQTMCYSDNSGFMKIYYYKEIVSDSFLTLAKHIKASSENLDFEGIAQFIRMGYCFDKTYVEGLSILNKRFYIKWAHNEMSILSKGISAITDKGTDFYAYFQKLTKTLEGKKVICDLTGGTDSRMLVSLMEYYKAQYDVSLSGREDFIDHIKCVEISGVLEKKPIFFEHSEEIDESICNEIFEDSDAQYPILEAYRNYCYDKNLKNAGFYIRITGGNGELFKDEAWPKPYFLFSNKMVRRFWRKKCIKFKENCVGLTDTMLGEIEKANDTIANIKRKLELNSATQTLDNFLYENIMFYKASNFNIIANNVGLKQYSPLLEYDIARVGFNLKRFKRKRIRFHKEVITKVCPQIAKIKTAKNYTCYNTFLYIVHDYIVDIERVIKQVYQRLFKSAQLVTDGATGDKLYYNAKKNCGEVEALLKKYNVIESSYKLSVANNVMFNRLYTIGLFLRQIG